MSRIVRIEIDLDKNKTRTLVNEDMPEQQKKDILNYILILLVNTVIGHQV